MVSKVVVLDGAAVRVQEEALSSIANHLIRPLLATAVATWQGSGGSLDIAAIRRKYGIDVYEEPDMLLEKHIRQKIDVQIPLDGPFRSVLYNAYTKYRAYEHVKTLDFDWLVYSRSDMHWFADLPPDYLWENATNTVWMPDAADWGGFYDRAAVIPRRFAKSYMQGPLQLILRAIEYVPSVSGELHLELMSSERWLHRALVADGAEFGSFPVLGAIRRCNKNVTACQDHLSSAQKLDRAPEWRHRAPEWRYIYEFVDASNAAWLANLSDSRWMLGWGRREMYPSCWHSEFGATIDRCCKHQDLVTACFESEFYTWRRCCVSTAYLTLTNPRGKSCWSLVHTTPWVNEQSIDPASLRKMQPFSCLPPPYTFHEPEMEL